MSVVTLLAIGSLALAPSLALADDTLLKAAGRFGDPVIVALLIFAESSPPQSGGRTHDDGNPQVGNHDKSIQSSENNARPGLRVGHRPCCDEGNPPHSNSQWPRDDHVWSRRQVWLCLCQFYPGTRCC